MPGTGATMTSNHRLPEKRIAEPHERTARDTALRIVPEMARAMTGMRKHARDARPSAEMTLRPRRTAP